MNKKDLSCTSILIGKDATVDGSTIIARNEDGYLPAHQKTFTVRPAKDTPNNIYVSAETGVKVPLPEHSYRYTCEPDPTAHPMYEEAGINEKNVAMSATETTYTNQRFLGYDPLVENGINEDSMLTLVLPYINSAREGVKRLGSLIEKYGTGQSNGISFADHDEVWYLETAGGHHWAAMRIPDDAYAVIANQISIQELKLDDPDHYLYDANLPTFVKEHHLNLTPNHFNFREIAGTSNEGDAHYNTPRVWYGQKLFNPEITQEPTSQKLPFIRRSQRKLTVEDVEFYLSSHYQQTPYDPFTHHDEYVKPTFRSIALDRNEISHILQIRNDVKPELAGVEWVALGFLSYSPYVPFYTNVNAIANNYQTAGEDVSMDSASWMYQTLSVLVEPHYHDFISTINEYREQCQEYAIQQLNSTDQQAKALTGEDLTNYLTTASLQTADHITAQTKHLMSDLIKQALNLSHIKFGTGDRL